MEVKIQQNNQSSLEQKQEQINQEDNLKNILSILFYSNCENLHQQSCIKIRNLIGEKKFQFNQYTVFLKKQIQQMIRYIQDPKVKYEVLNQLIINLYTHDFSLSLQKITLKTIGYHLPKDINGNCYLQQIFLQNPIVQEKVLNCQEVDGLLDYVLTFENIDFSDFMNINQLIDKALSKSKQNKQLMKMIQMEKYQKYQSYIFQNYNNVYYASFLADIIQKLKLDESKYPQIKKNLQKGFVRYYVKSYEWQRVEQKLQNDPKILGYAIEEMYKKTNFDILYGIISRQNLLNKNCLTNQNIINQYKQYQSNESLIQNELYTKDTFTYTEKFFMTQQQQKQKQPQANEEQQKDQLDKKEKEKIQEELVYMELEQYNIKVDDVIIINNSNSKAFNDWTRELLESEVVGVDSEFTNSYTKLDSQGEIALLQLATPQHIVLFDMPALKQQQVFIEFLQQFLSSNNILKVGHSLSTDIIQLNQTISTSTGFTFTNYIDISEIFKTYYPSNKFSLQFIVNTLFSKQFSKFEQCSNWQARPLRLSQLHYAALDAYVCLLIHQHFINNSIQLQPFIHYNYITNTQTIHDQHSKQVKVYTHQLLQDIIKNKYSKAKNTFFQKQIDNFQIISINELNVKNFDRNEKLNIVFDDIQIFSRLEFFLKNVKEQLTQFEYETSIIKDYQRSQTKNQIIFTKDISKYNDQTDVPVFQIGLQILIIQLAQITKIIQELLQIINSQ